MAENQPFKMGKREQARRAKKKRRRLLIILLCIPIALLIGLAVVVALRMSSGSSQPTEAPPAITETTAVTDNIETDEEEIPPTVTESAEPSEAIIEAPEVTEPVDETEAPIPSESNPGSDTGSAENNSGTQSGDSSNSGGSSSRKNSGSGNKSSGGSGGNSGSSSGGNGGNSSGGNGGGSSGGNGGSSSSGNGGSSSGGNGGSSSGGNGSTSTETIKTATLSSPVSSVTQGASGTLGVTVTGSSGTNLTSQCTITYTGTGCTINGNRVTFDQVGTATIYASITYNGSTINTNTISITVAKPDLNTASITAAACDCLVGNTTTLTASALDTRGNDVSAECAVIWNADGCSVTADGAVTFTQAGTATVTATVTYNGKTVTTEAVSFVVSNPPLASASLSTDTTEVQVDDTAILTVTALDSRGNDITDQCSIVWTADGCAVASDGTVTFTQARTATVTAAVTYQDKTVTTDAISFTVSEPPARLTDLTVEGAVADAELGESLTLTVTPLDQEGNPLSEAAVQLTGENCNVADATVTFDQPGTAVITVEATLEDATLTRQITVTVHHTVTLSDGTTVDLTALDQAIEQTEQGWSLRLPTLFTSVSTDNDTSVYSCQAMPFTVTVRTVDLTAETDEETIQQRYDDRLAELNGDASVSVLHSSCSQEDNTYTLQWQQGNQLTAEQFTLGTSSCAAITAEWDAQQFPAGESLWTYILATWSPDV